MHQIAEHHLGMAGAMLSGSKQKPHGCEDHTIYWNACVFAAEGRTSKAKHTKAVQIWHGDLDVTAQEDALVALATELNKTIYVTPESPWRFDGFEQAMKRYDPRWDRPYLRFNPA